jgi:Tol biopolymer transport system component
MTIRTLYLPVMIAAAVAVACSVVTLLALSEKEAQAAFPGKNGRIAFSGMVTEEGSTDQIFTIKPDGTGEKQLTDTSPRSFNVTPSYSPDGTKIAWEWNGDIWIMNADGTNRHRLTERLNTTGPWGDASPAFSPDGTKVAFSRYDPESDRSDIYIKVLGGAIRPVTNDKARDGYPVFSPDGTKIAFSRSAAKPGCNCFQETEIASVRPDGTGLKVITNTPDPDAAGGPDWSPDGRRLVFERYVNAWEVDRIETIRADGTGRRTVFYNHYFSARDPVFSPDGNKIAFNYQLGVDILKINPDGTGLTNVTDTPNRWERSPDWGPRPTAATTR